MVRFILLAAPRTGSTWLMEMLKRNQQIAMAGELLNTCEEDNQLSGGPEAIMTHINQTLNELTGTAVGFKLFPSQLIDLNINLADLMRCVNASCLIILWRKSAIETCWSLQMAEKTDVWYTFDKTAQPTPVKMPLSPKTIEDFLFKWNTLWEITAKQIPRETSKHFLTYEDLLADPKYELGRIFDFLRAPVRGIVVKSSAGRQNPFGIEEKLPNYKDLPEDLRESTIDVPKIFSSVILSAIADPNVIRLLPNIEPIPPAGGWLYTVAEPLITAKMKENVLDALDTGMISSAGPWPKMMASKLRNLYEVPVAQPCCNGFSALMLALQALNIGNGDEVVVPSFTMIAVSNAVIYCGAKPIFVDNAEGRYNPGRTELFEAVSERTKAIVVCHTYGVPVDSMNEILNECESRKIWLIEDISECAGVTVLDSDGNEKLLGTFGHFACASLYANKILHSGDGGFVISKLGGMGGRLASLVNHGFTPGYHFVHFEPCINAKISGICAAIGCATLDCVEKIMQNRRELAQQFRAELSETPLALLPECGPKDTPWVFGIVCRSKDERTLLRAALATDGIETRDFFFPLHLQPAYSGSLLSENLKLPNSEKLGSCGFYLPTHSNLIAEDVKIICAPIRKYFELKTDQSVDQRGVRQKRRAMRKVLRLNPESFNLETRWFSRDGKFVSVDVDRQTVKASIVEVVLECERHLITEKWDIGQKLSRNIKWIIEVTSDMDCLQVREYLQPYLEYLEAFSNAEMLPSGPWKQVDLTKEPFAAAESIPTTTDIEVLQLLVFLIRKLKATRVLELGSWLGRATYIMAAAVEENGEGQVIAIDEFFWQLWMDPTTLAERNINHREDFFDKFENNIAKYKKTIKGIRWDLATKETLPKSVQQQYFDIVYVDFTTDREEMTAVWPHIRDCCIPNKTVIVFNGIRRDLLGFFIEFAHELQPIAKPRSHAKAFLFGRKVEKIFLPAERLNVSKKLNFTEMPEWQHLHNRSFCATIELLKHQYHSETAEIAFIPAVEVYLCDHQGSLKQPWIGIVHGVPQCPGDFYVPDLNRLCSKKYRKYMQMCRGIFTLTEAQKKYLESHLPADCKVPISALKYPFSPVSDNMTSSQLIHSDSNSIFDVCFIGSFVRNFEHFFNVQLPENFRKKLLVESNIFPPGYIPSDITIITRLNDFEYEQLLANCVPFLSLRYGGAANTLIIECIARCVPLLAPKMDSVVEYLGEEYPLLFEVGQLDFTELLTAKNIRLAIEYLQKKDKSPFQQEEFSKAFEKSAVLANCPLPISEDNLRLNPTSFEQLQWKFDCSICICSYKRTHNLKELLNELWHNQTFEGTIEIIVWNNNSCRSDEVKRICDEFIPCNSCQKSIVLIDSSRNFYCSIRMALPTLARSDSILICDDDILPRPTYVEFFMSAAAKYPSDILCTRGHKFLPHELDAADPQAVWLEYQHVKFVNDSTVEQHVHFVHMDTCLLPKSALQECTSINIPDPTFALVDDYWMSYVLSHKFSRKFRKLQVDCENLPFLRTEDSEDPKVALYKQPEVVDAKIRLYVHHMINGWPNWTKNPEPVAPENHFVEVKWNKIAEYKQNVWKETFIGFNVSSRISASDAESLQKLGVSHVRIGAVGVKEDYDWEFCEFLTNPEQQLNDLVKCVEMLSTFNINVTLTLDSRLATPSRWHLIAKAFATEPRVVGYDLINEPVIEGEDLLHCSDADSIDCDLSELIRNYKEISVAIRRADSFTPIIIEPSFWGKFCRFPRFMKSENLKFDPILMTSLHFYEPRTLTSRKDNRGRFAFPSAVPKFSNSNSSETYDCDEKYLKSLLINAADLSEQVGIPVFIGELGIPRETSGAADYMITVVETCKKLNMSVFIYAFRENTWEAMNYEIPTNFDQRTPVWNALTKAIQTHGKIAE